MGFSRKKEKAALSIVGGLIVMRLNICQGFCWLTTLYQNRNIASSIFFHKND
jgi:hypothetical protein